MKAILTLKEVGNIFQEKFSLMLERAGVVSFFKTNVAQVAKRVIIDVLTIRVLLRL